MARAVVILDLRMNKFTKGLQKAQKSWKKFSRVATSALGAVGISVGMSKMLSFAESSIALAKEQADAEAGLAAAMKQSGTFTNARFEDLTKYASALQAVTTYGDEATIAVMRQLTQFGLYGDQLKRATKLTLDMASSGYQLQGSALLIGKAFKGEFGSMSRYGVVLEESIPKAEKFAAALGQMEKQFGGQAEALGKLDINKLEQMKNVWGDIKEKIGEGVANALSKMADATFRGAEGMAKWNEENGKLLSANVSGALLDIASTLGKIVGYLEKIEAIGGLGARAFALPFEVGFGGGSAFLSGKDPFAAMGKEFSEFGEAFPSAWNALTTRGRTLRTADEMATQADLARSAPYRRKLDKIAEDLVATFGNALQKNAQKVQRLADQAGTAH